ncbi:MAG: 5-oxoprolinase subunit PxpB [Chitinophagales bacterium]|nr:5-oxoprolinase subunit PxpB [Chitinophagales bacterium]
MNYVIPAYRIFPLGDTALVIDYGNLVDEAVNKEVMSRFAQLKNANLPGVIEVVPAYSSLAVYYHPPEVWKKRTRAMTVYEWMKDEVGQLLAQPVANDQSTERLLTIPVCYEDEFAPDIRALSATKNISVEEIIQLHTATTYRVYMLGFLPGFSYMGEVDERISIARKPQPVNVTAGSVGIAGRQTGIYPLASPGGWQIIGRTPLKLFDVKKEEPALFKAGDKVQFISISKNEFANY